MMMVVVMIDKESQGGGERTENEEKFSLVESIGEQTENEEKFSLVESKPGRFCIFFNNTIHYTIFQSIGPIQYNTNTIQYLKELYPIHNNNFNSLNKKSLLNHK